MKQLCILAALMALWGCRAVQQEAGVPITFAPTEQTPSKSNTLAAGDVVGLFATTDGTDRYFMENASFTTGADGRSLSTTPAVYYPEAKQAMNFYAYFPYGAGTSFSVPSNQSTASALQAADLCWAKASSTPIASAVPLQFGHKMARLVVAANQTPSKIMAPNAFSGGLLDIRTGLFTNTIKSSVSTTGNGLILPAQTVTRLVLTVAGVEYVFEGAIALEAAKTTTANLTLNTTTKTATLSGSSTINWTSSASSDTPAQSVSNVLTLHWPNYLSQGATPDKVAFTINNVEYTISSGITYADQTFTVPFTSTTLRYPYTIAKIAFYRGTSVVFPTCTNLFGATIYKSTASTIGIKDHANAVLINGLWWATGYLIADGPNRCKIGKPTDCGLYFQTGSLIGWSGGASATNYDGRGIPSLSPAVAKVYPANMDPTYLAMLTSMSSDGSTSILNRPYFSVTAPPYNTDGTDLRGYNGAPNSGSVIDPSKSNLGNGRYIPMGIGDPCTYYLGALWQTPKKSDIAYFINNGSFSAFSNMISRHSTSGLQFIASSDRNKQDNTGNITSSELGNHFWIRSFTLGPTGAAYGVWSFAGDVSDIILHTAVITKHGVVTRCLSRP